MAQGLDGPPLLLGVGLGDTRVLVDARHFHAEIEFRFALIGKAGDRRGAGRGRRAGQRDMTFAGEQAGGRVQADPAGTRHEHLGPSVQVGEIGLGAGRAVQGLEIGGQLNQVAGHETRRQSQVPQDLHQ